MTNSQTPMEDPAGVAGSMNLNINLPEGLYLTTTPPEMMAPASGNVTGSIIIFAGSTAPDGWLLCNGAAVSRATYADLFTVIGTNYGVGNANTTFNLPDLRGRFPLGKDDMGGVSADVVTAAEADVLGSRNGAETHTLTTNEMPNHGHSWTAESKGTPGTLPEEMVSARGMGQGTIFTDGDQYRRVHPASALLNPLLNSGNDQAHNNMPPYQTLNYIIKT